MTVLTFDRKYPPDWWVNFVKSCAIYMASMVLYADYNAIVEYDYSDNMYSIEFRDDDLFTEFLLRWS